jgi:hypothetical protein
VRPLRLATNFCGEPLIEKGAFIMRKSSLVPLFAILLLAFAMPSEVLAGDVYHFRGEYVYASFYSTDSLGCIVTSAYVSATNGWTQDTGRPTTSSWGYLSIYQYDQCHGYQPLLSGYWSGGLAAGTLDISSALNTASLKTVAQVYDYFTGSYRAVSIDLTWTGNDVISRGQSHTIFQSPGSWYSTRYNGTSRGADVAGSISAGFGNQMVNAYYGGLSSSQSGSVTIN